MTNICHYKASNKISQFTTFAQKKHFAQDRGFSRLSIEIGLTFAVLSFHLTLWLSFLFASVIQTYAHIFVGWYRARKIIGDFTKNLILSVILWINILTTNNTHELDYVKFT